MDKKVPVVNMGLLGEENWITDFIQVRNPKLLRVASRLRGESVDEKISAVARYVAKTLKYPLDFRGRPTAAHSTKAFKWWNGLFLSSHSPGYGWLFPSQTCQVKKGICMDSSCVCTTLLRIKNVKAWTVIGVVLRTRGKKILGPHAWTEAVRGNTEHIVLETTVHPEPAKTVLAKDIYNGDYPVTYDPIAWFNEAKYMEDKAKADKYEMIFDGEA